MFGRTIWLDDVRLKKLPKRRTAILVVFRTFSLSW